MGQRVLLLLLMLRCAALRCAGGVRVGPEEYGQHAQRAHEAGALRVLCALTARGGLAPNAAEMASNILLRRALLTYFCFYLIFFLFSIGAFCLFSRRSPFRAAP